MSELLKVLPHLLIPDIYFRGELTYKEYVNVPFVSWPGGRPCVVANLYVLELLRRGLSTRGRGGSVRQLGHNISHLLRYCDRNGIELFDMTNDRFVLFYKGLSAERLPGRPEVRVRQANARISIGRASLDFMDYVSRLFGADDFLGANGRIKAIKRVAEIKVGVARQIVTRNYWHHDCFDKPDPQRHRSPIDAGSILLFYKSIVAMGSSSHRVRRRQCFLRLLEMLGPRVGELALLRTSDVLDANKMEWPLLRIATLKRRGSRVDARDLPVLRQDLSEIVRYIRVHRAKVIRETLGARNDHGFVFVSETTGRPMSARTLSNEIGLLRRYAKIERKACAHMFRNRFITKMLIWLIEQYDLQNPDQLRKALLSTETLMKKVSEWSGHTSIISLEPYIDLAFEEFTRFSKVVARINFRRAYESFDSHMQRLVEELEAGMISASEFRLAFDELFRDRLLDVRSIEEGKDVNDVAD